MIAAQLATIMIISQMKQTVMRESHIIEEGKVNLRENSQGIKVPKS